MRKDPRHWFPWVLILSLMTILSLRAFAAVMAQADLSTVRVMPNPWRSDRHAQIPVRFDPLTTRTTVKIFTTSGRWVKTLTSNGIDLTWDLTNSSGERVAS